MLWKWLGWRKAFNLAYFLFYYEWICRKSIQFSKNDSPAPELCKVPGARVHTESVHITSINKCCRWFESLEKSKLVWGTVSDTIQWPSINITCCWARDFANKSEKMRKSIDKYWRALHHAIESSYQYKSRE